ncbi:hypothetical protein CP556_20615 [Natrinema sp. CBA1119]|uniref:hypothetical protein n=1 Tax=Natrinema sp. CBA1119 TaxID=1608465 RepID=UPI000BF4EA74|nr:hypothetical protein [Natrinema sp. CBA1119]PGF14517.1 hypothetical protein CP556_20615 [Natrinema sp. CBA1119]
MSSQIPDGRYVNLNCPECQAHPGDIEIVFDRKGWLVLRCTYCLVSFNASIDADQPVQARHPPNGEFDDRLFQTDD